jgi:hypothetical protein
MTRRIALPVRVFVVGALSIVLLSIGGVAGDADAQVAGGTVSGRVTDPSGSVLPGASVSITNVATGVLTSSATNTDGFYSVANLLPGTYKIAVALTGFAEEIASGITVSVGSQVTVNLRMKLGPMSEQVLVTAAATLVDIKSSTLSGVVGERAIRDLPLNGRDWTQLATLEPGVATVRSQMGLSSERGQRGLGTQMTISGGRPQQNNYRLDGVNINDYSNGGPGSVLGLNLGVDAVAEFSVLTSNYSAEYGRTSGGVINGITRSGSNDVHGDTYFFRRDSALDAPNYFDNGNKPPFYRDQYGAAIGAPIKKDKTFLFFDYEGIRQSLGQTTVDTMPTAAARQGHIHDANGNPLDIAVSPLIVPYLPFFPLPNGAPVGPDTGIWTFTSQNVTREEFATGRIDHNISGNSRLFGTYMFDQGRTSSPDQTNAKIQQFRSRRQLFTLEENQTFGKNLLNAARFGVSRIRANIQETLDAVNPAAGDLSLGTVPGRAAAQIAFPGTTAFLGGAGGITTFNFFWTSLQAYDDALYTAGKHSIKFGGSMENIRSQMDGISNPNGVWNFTSLQTFLQDIPRNLSAALPGTITPRNVRQWVIGAYINDDYRPKPNLTLNLGLRYEMATIPTETDGKLSTLVNMSDAAPHTGDPYFSNPTLKNFEPRVGFAWDPTGSGKTAIRGGVGIFDVLPLPYQYELPVLFAAPFFQLGQTANNLPQGTFPTAGFSLLSARTFRAAYIEPNPKRNYVYQYNVNVQRELAANLTALVAYAGSRGLNQAFRADTVNYVLPTGKDSAGNYTWPIPRGSGTIINPNYSRIDGLMWINDSWYNSLQLQLKKRMSHGVQVQGSYTWSRSLDTGSAGLAGDTFVNSVKVLPFFDSELRKGPSDFNLTHNAMINVMWAVPGSESSGGLKRWISSGWQVGSIVSVSSGSTFTPIIDGDPLGLNGSASFAFPNVLSGPGCDTLVNPGNVAHYIKTECFAMPNPSTTLGNVRRNSLVGPALANVDLSFFKNNYLKKGSERQNVQLRVEIFNVLNRANFAAPCGTCGNTSLFDQNGAPLATAGQITGTQTTARQVQLALKVIF